MGSPRLRHCSSPSSRHCAAVLLLSPSPAVGAAPPTRRPPGQRRLPRSTELYGALPAAPSRKGANGQPVLPSPSRRPLVVNTSKVQEELYYASELKKEEQCDGGSEMLLHAWDMTSAIDRTEVAMPAAVAWRWIWRRPAALSAPGRVLQISGAFSSSRSPSAQATTEAAAWRSPTPTPTWWPAGLGQARQFGTAKHRQPEKQHLYLVLDDNPNGFNIHKLDMDNDLDDAGCGSAESPLCLPDPPILQVGPPTIRWHTKFAAMGSHIIGICPSEGTLLFDTKKSTLAMSTVRPDVIITMDGYEAAIAVGNKLYVFESFSHNDRFDGPYFPGGFHCLAADLKGAEKDWTWKPLSCDSPFRWSWNKRPPEFPIIAGSIYAHVVHPRTGTIFLSAFGQPRPRTHIWGDGRWGTFAYATKGRGQWKRLRGDWLLPFNGPGHYDHVLGAWVGLYLGRPPVPNVFVSFLCACPVMSGWQQPQWIVGRQKLSWDDPRWMSTLDDVKLIRMAKRGEYCLLERLLPQGEKDKMKYVIRLTTFAVKYGENGELTTMAHRPPRFYQAPSYHHRFDMQAFWM